MIAPADVKQILARHMLADGLDLVMDLDKSRGSWLADGLTGEMFLDMYSMYASQAVGYNHPRLVEAREELGRAAVVKPSCSEIYTTQMAEFMEVFARMAMPDHLPRAFFIEGGALAVENALKAAFDWKARLNISRGKGEQGGKIIHFRQAFHGRSGYTLSLTNTDSAHKIAHFPIFDWPRVTNPKAAFPLTGDNLARTEELERRAEAEILAAIDRWGDDIAGLIIEPIQGEGGDNHFRPEFFALLRRLCTDNDILLIFDEVQTGVGLTGKFWAHEHYGIEPDLLSFGKKTQVCGALAGPRLDEVENNVFRQSGRISSTWGGNLVDMVRSRHILLTIEAENLVERAAENGSRLLEMLQGLAAEFPGLVGNPRGLGLLCSFDLPSADHSRDFIRAMWERRVILAPCGVSTIRLRPHLVTEVEELELAIGHMRRVLGGMVHQKAA